jgi:RNA polymerase sigma-70 factor, ECF subfamily
MFVRLWPEKQPMPAPLPEGVSKILTDRAGGDRDALDKVMPLVYDELRNLAHRYMLQERGGHTLQTTALVNEVYLKFANRDGLRAQNRAHFLALAARQMRCILVDYARGRAREKRGGDDAQKVPLDEAVVVSNDRTAEMLALDEALNGLAKFDERKSRVAELRFFAGLTVEETAEALSISPETVNRDWRLAKAWLRKELDRQ